MCVEGRCERDRRAPGCQCYGPGPGPGSCANPNTFCDFNFGNTTRTSDEVCIYGSLPTGAPCDSDAQCARPDCDSASKSCAPLPPPPPGSAPALGDECNTLGRQFSCESGRACITIETGFARGCYSRRPDQARCVSHYDCESGSCNTDTNECVAAFSLPNGANCTDFSNCESGVCSSNGVFSVCKERAYFQGQDGPCGTDSDCLMGYRCAGSPGYGVCKNVQDLECSRTGSSVCGPNAQCTCTGTTYRCVARSVPNTQCATEFVAFRKMYSTVLSFGTWSNPSDSSVMDWAKPWAWYPQEVKDAAAKYGCCLLTKGGVGADLFENSYLGQVQMDTRLNCVVDPPVWEHLPVDDDNNNKRCTKTEYVPVSDLVVGRIAGQSAAPFPDPLVQGSSPALGLVPGGWVGLVGVVGAVLVLVM